MEGCCNGKVNRMETDGRMEMDGMEEEQTENGGEGYRALIIEGS